MSSGIDATMANAILDALYPNSGTKTIGTVTITGPTHTRLMTANGSDTAAGTELGTSGGYTAGGASSTYASSASQAKSTNADTTWTNMPAATETGVETWDTSGTPLRIQWAGFSSSVTTASGDTLTIPSGQQTAGLT
jgi:hypothetical protein